jgi:hypothetical protein
VREIRKSKQISGCNGKENEFKYRPIQNFFQTRAEVQQRDMETKKGAKENYNS